jgi:hypothetical protein
MTAAATLTPAELAAELGTDARTARKFLRSITPKDEQPGKGSRWALKGTKTAIAAYRKQFTAFETAQAEAKAKREAARAAAEVTPEIEPEIAADEIETELEPTDDEIAALDDEALDIE